MFVKVGCLPCSDSMGLNNVLVLMDNMQPSVMYVIAMWRGHF